MTNTNQVQPESVLSKKFFTEEGRGKNNSNEHVGLEICQK
jgi:hypothetical protein